MNFALQRFFSFLNKSASFNDGAGEIHQHMTSDDRTVSRRNINRILCLAVVALGKKC